MNVDVLGALSHVNFSNGSYFGLFQTADLECVMSVTERLLVIPFLVHSFIVLAVAPSEIPAITCLGFLDKSTIVYMFA